MDLQVNPLWHVDTLEIVENHFLFLYILQRMRSLPDGWTGATMAMHDKYKTRIKLADQDILNILFRFIEISLSMLFRFTKISSIPYPGSTNINILFRITEKSSIHISCWCSHTFLCHEKILPFTFCHAIQEKENERLNDKFDSCNNL